jgi:hypothetical protein
MLVLAGLFFVLMAAALVLGLTSSAPGLMVLGLFGFGPAFTFCLGFGLGRASNEFVIVRRERTAVTPTVVNGRQPQRQPVERERLG